MASSTETTKRRHDLAVARSEGSHLCDAVAMWVRALGGVPIHIDDLRVKEIDKGRYRVSVRVKGTWPKAKYTLK